MPVAIAERQYPFPFRTRKSSSPAPMILPCGGKVGSCRLFFRAVSSAGTSVWFTPRMSGVRSSHCPFKACGFITGFFYLESFVCRNSRHSVRRSGTAFANRVEVNPKKLLAQFFLTDLLYGYVGSSILSLPNQSLRFSPWFFLF